MPRSLFQAAGELPVWLHGRHIGDLEPATRDERSQELLSLAADCDDPDARQGYLDQVVLLNGPVAESIAARYRQRGIESDDLVQVAYLGLVKASQGYRLGEGPSFLSYAVPTISGEIKRHFRDFGWVVRPPRRLQELRSQVAVTRSDLQQENGRLPTSDELADRLGVPRGEVDEAERADGCFSAVSLDSPGRPGTVSALADLLVDEADHFDHVENMEALRPALQRLSERDRRILLLRFVRGWTQEQIGQEIGVSQMQVSRLLNRILLDLRADIFKDEPVA
ncbi:sigma-70 family RNA polymerase sigma factor [Austwickia chelonae]|uniref:sigma-70 family RNA polymerase sigma factor n=1 Tax=Austwickia chelonae TaxID=100225 RepID=UPI001F088242|nr:sigma-70 family RNA polymerase sigma factor [Austwickia chelonae]